MPAPPQIKMLVTVIKVTQPIRRISAQGEIRVMEIHVIHGRVLSTQALSEAQFKIIRGILKKRILLNIQLRAL